VSGIDEFDHRLLNANGWGNALPSTCANRLIVYFQTDKKELVVRVKVRFFLKKFEHAHSLTNVIKPDMIDELFNVFAREMIPLRDLDMKRKPRRGADPDDDDDDDEKDEEDDDIQRERTKFRPSEKRRRV
jgi:hypothetical protein